ncbi:Alcohol O-acetyltransferase [Boothiomyces sp. JEL0838]|nr:Alcohol O-acetyltransferase [Boothiomyces sp. JEL0838]
MMMQGRPYTTKQHNHQYKFPTQQVEATQGIAPACEPYSSMDPKVVDLSLPVPQHMSDFGYHYDPNHYHHHHGYQNSGMYYSMGLEQMPEHQLGMADMNINRLRNMSQNSFMEEHDDAGDASWEPEQTKRRVTRKPKKRDSKTESVGSVGSNEDAMEDKRKKFLERNRLAASKCRQKKKMWMQELESKSSEIFQRNRDLQNLTNQLKDQVAELSAQLHIYQTQCKCSIPHIMSNK